MASATDLRYTQPSPERIAGRLSFLTLRPILEGFPALDSMDLVSEVLRGIRLKGAIYVDGRFTAPWSIAVNMTPDDCRPFMDRPAGVICYHVIIAGSAFVTVEGIQAVRLTAGNAVLFPQNAEHVLSSALGLPPTPAGEILQSIGREGATAISHGGGGEPTHFVCGFLAGETPAEPLFAVLPPLLATDLRAAPAREWVEASVRFAAAELAAGRLASSALMTHLSESC